MTTWMQDFDAKYTVKDIKLYLDDVRNAPEGWHRVLTIHELKQWCRSYWDAITSISLDHDLGYTQDTGYDFLVWLEEFLHFNVRYSLTFPIMVHSANPSGAAKMRLAIKRLVDKHGIS